MHIPFVEHRVLSIELSGEQLYWIELSRLGSRHRIVNYGQKVWNGSDEDKRTILTEIKDQLKADYFKVVVSCPDLLDTVETLEAPYGVPESELEVWAEEEASKLEEDTQNGCIFHIVEIDSEQRRGLFQRVDQEQRSKLVELFSQAGLPPWEIYTSATERGYPLVVSVMDAPGELFGVLSGSGKAPVLATYFRGLPIGLYPLGGAGGEAQQADSILRTEESVLQMPLGAHVLYTEGSADQEYEQRTVERLQVADDVGTNLHTEYSGAYGAAVKAGYPALDSFSLSGLSERLEAARHVDKARFVKTLVLLAAPLVLFFLLGTAASQWYKAQLAESSQVIRIIEGELAEVETLRGQVRELSERYRQQAGTYNRQTQLAKVFEVLDESVSREIYLDQVAVSGEPSTFEFTLYGRASSPGQLSVFLENLDRHKWVGRVSLENSRAANPAGSYEFTINGRLGLDE